MRRATAWQLGWPLLFLGAGLLVGDYPILSSGFRRCEGDLGDARLINYLLEHCWRWINRVPSHLELWSPPFFFPEKNVGAYSEILLGAAPPYMALRALGLEVDTAFQVWILTLGALNFATMYLLLRRCFRRERVSSAAGATLFAFSAPRLAHVGHYQLYAQYWTVLALWAVGVAGTSPSIRNRRIAIVAFFVCCACQLWASFYLGFFLLLALAIALLVALATRAGRAFVSELVRHHAPFVVAGALLGAASLWSFVSHYVVATSSTGERAFTEALTMIPEPRAWMHLAATSWIYGGLARSPLFAGITMEHEQRLGIGIVTLGVGLTGLVLGRKEPPLLIGALSAALLAIVATQWHGQTAWLAVYRFVPGGKALRAVARIVLVVVVPVVWGVARALDAVARRGVTGTIAAAALGLVVLAEQGQEVRSFDKATNRHAVAAVAAAIDSTRCDAFLLSALAPRDAEWKYHLDAMWASLESGVPTINGHSAWFPPGYYPLMFSMIQRPEDNERVGRALDSWVRTKHLVLDRLCWVRMEVPDTITYGTPVWR